MREPDFFVVGAAKSGTTALWKYFQQHPKIFVTNNIASKELGYFSNEYGINNKNQYLNHFKDAKDNQLIGEVCHVYLTSKVSAERIKKIIPNAKIIIVLRNPIDRAISLYNWMVMHGYENSLTFEDALKKEEDIENQKYDKTKLLHKFHQNYDYYKTGLYYEQVKKYYETFRIENVLVIEYEDFKRDSLNQLHEIFNFLNVDDFNILENKSINTSKRIFSNRLQYFSRRILLSKFRKRAIIKSIFNFILTHNTLNKEPKEMLQSTRASLSVKYKKDIERLSKLTNINFESKWNEKVV